MDHPAILVEALQRRALWADEIQLMLVVVFQDQEIMALRR